MAPFIRSRTTVSLSIVYFGDFLCEFTFLPLITRDWYTVRDGKSDYLRTHRQDGLCWSWVRTIVVGDYV